jgi:fructuronate reductase
MKVVINPGIIDPKNFIDEVINKRLPNPFIPDSPQRIATDTSQKIPIRFGETIKAYMNSEFLDSSSLIGIPLSIAAWLRYILAIDDKLNKIELSPDPILSDLKSQLSKIIVGQPETYNGELKSILSNESIFGVDLYKANLGDKIEAYFSEMIEGKDSVRSTLIKYLY